MISHMERQQIEKLGRQRVELERQQAELEKQQVEELAKQRTEELEKQQIERFQRYAAEGRRYLMSTYFSDKTIFGGNIFEEKKTKDGGTIKMSSVPGYQSYADPAKFAEGSSSRSKSTVETPLHGAKRNISGAIKTKAGETTKVNRVPRFQSRAEPANFSDDSSDTSMSF